MVRHGMRGKFTEDEVMVVIVSAVVNGFVDFELPSIIVARARAAGAEVGRLLMTGL